MSNSSDEIIGDPGWAAPLSVAPPGRRDRLEGFKVPLAHASHRREAPLTEAPISPLLLLIGLCFSPTASAGAEEVERLLRAEQLRPALDEARRSVDANDRDVESHELLIDILMNVGLGYDAQEAYRGRLDERQADPMAWYLFGRAALTAQEAREAYTKALSLDPQLGRAWMGLAAIERAEGDQEKAAERYEQALRLDPSLSEAWTGLGATYISRGDFDGAVGVCRRALKAVPGDPEAYLALAAMSPDEAAAVLAAGVKAVPTEPRMHEALAREQINAGDLKAARQSLQRALTLNPASAQAHLDLVLIQELEAGRIDAQGQADLARARALREDAPLAARDALDQLTARYPDCFLVFLARGHMRSELGDMPGAESDLRRAVELSPQSPDAQGALGMLLLSRNRPKEAAPLLDAARAQRPRDVTLGIAAGMAHVVVDGPATGVRVLDQVASQHPDDPRPIMAIVSVLTQAGDAEGAYTVLKRAIVGLPEPSLVLSFAAAAKDIGRDQEAIDALRSLERMTGEARYGRMARALEAEQGGG